MATTYGSEPFMKGKFLAIQLTTKHLIHVPNLTQEKLLHTIYDLKQTNCGIGSPYFLALNAVDPITGESFRTIVNIDQIVEMYEEVWN